MGRFVAKREDGTILTNGTQIRTFRDDLWILGGVSHPRKIWVYWDKDPKGSKTYPNRTSMEFYANVFKADEHGKLGIWDNLEQEWSFAP